jgi:hypothetical protein
MRRNQTRKIKGKKPIKTVLAKFNESGHMLCSSCNKPLHPYMWLQGEGNDNLFKCACNKIVRAVYPTKKTVILETHGKKT